MVYTVESSFHCFSWAQVSGKNAIATAPARHVRTGRNRDARRPSGCDQQHQAGQRQIHVTAMKKIARIQRIQIQSQKKRQDQQEYSCDQRELNPSGLFDCRLLMCLSPHPHGPRCEYSRGAR